MEEKKEKRNKNTKAVGNGEGSFYYSEALDRYVYQYYIEGNPKRQTMTQRKNEQVREFKARVRELKTKLDNGKTNVDKGKRTFLMTPETKKIISEILQEKITNINNLLFWDYERNSLILPKRINDFLEKLNKNDISNNLKTHKLRHTFITRCQEKGIPLVVIQAMVGHVEGSSITNDVYTSVSLDFMKEQLEKIS